MNVKTILGTFLNIHNEWVGTVKNHVKRTFNDSRVAVTKLSMEIQYIKVQYLDKFFQFAYFTNKFVNLKFILNLLFCTSFFCMRQCSYI